MVFMILWKISPTVMSANPSLTQLQIYETQGLRAFHCHPQIVGVASQHHILIELLTADASDLLLPPCLVLCLASAPLNCHHLGPMPSMYPQHHQPGHKSCSEGSHRCCMKQINGVSCTWCGRCMNWFREVCPPGAAQKGEEQSDFEHTEGATGLWGKVDVGKKAGQTRYAHEKGHEDWWGRPLKVSFESASPCKVALHLQRAIWDRDTNLHPWPQGQEHSEEWTHDKHSSTHHRLHGRPSLTNYAVSLNLSAIFTVLFLTRTRSMKYDWTESTVPCLKHLIQFDFGAQCMIRRIGWASQEGGRAQISWMCKRLKRLKRPRLRSLQCMISVFQRFCNLYLCFSGILCSVELKTL